MKETIQSLILTIHSFDCTGGSLFLIYMKSPGYICDKKQTV